MSELNKIVWTILSFRFTHEIELERKKAFLELIMTSEPSFDFRPWAEEFLATEQWSNDGTYWTHDSPEKAQLDVKIQCYLDKLDNLQKSQPVAAIKIAAMITIINSSYFVRAVSAKERLLTWLRTTNIPLLQKIELAVLIGKRWPDRFTEHYAFREINHIIFDLLLEYAAVDPSKTMQIINEINQFSEFQIFYFCSQLVGEKATLARRLKFVDPFFSCCMMANFLGDARIFRERYDTPESYRKEVADELWQLVSEIDNAKAQRIYLGLLSSGFTSSDWWPQLLDKLLEIAKSNLDRNVFCGLAIHAPLNSAIFTEAMALYEHEINRFSQEPLRENEVWRFAYYLTEDIRIAADAKINRRNEAIAANPNHPLIVVAKKAYWQCFNWLLTSFPDQKYSYLEVAISSGDEEMSKQAADVYIDLCRAVTSQTKETVANALIDIRRHSYLNFTPPRENRPTRLIEIFDAGFARFCEVAPELAEETKRQAMRNLSRER